MKYTLLAVFTLTLLVGCLEYPFSCNCEEHNDETWLCSISSDSLNYNQLIIVDYEHYNAQLELKNYVLLNDKEVILNCGYKGIFLLNNSGHLTSLIDSLWIRHTELDIATNKENIVFSSRGDLFMLNLQSTQLLQITDTPSVYEDHPSFYDNNSKIVFTCVNNIGELNQYNSINSINVNGNDNYELLTNDSQEQNLSYPKIVKQNSLLLYNKFSVTYDLNLMYLETNENKIIATDLESNSKLSISNDESKVIISTEDSTYLLDCYGNLLFDFKKLISSKLNGGIISPNGKFAVVYSEYRFYKIDLQDKAIEFSSQGTSPECNDNIIYFNRVVEDVH